MPVGRRFGWMLVAALAACAGQPGGPSPIELDKECELDGTPCVDGAYCYHARCGYARGTCVAMPDACDTDLAPRCGCDGEVYDNACAAAMAGTPIGFGQCTAPAGLAGCGDRFCDVATEYCEFLRGGGGGTDEQRCLPLDCPAGSSGCACIDPEPCPKDDLFFSQTCYVSEDGGTAVECLRP